MKLLYVVHLITELDMGGAEEMLYKTVTRMDRKAFRCSVISVTDVGPVGKRIAAAGIPVVALGMARGRPSLKGALKLLRILRQEKPDIIQAWLYHADLLGLIASKLAGVRRVAWGIRCSNMELKNYRFLTTIVMKLSAMLSSFADAIVVNSEEGRRVHIQQGYSSKKMTLMPNGFDMELFSPDRSSRRWLLAQLKLKEDAVLVGLIARFDPMKGHREFFKAASMLASKEPSVHFVMAGKGIESHNKDLIPFLVGSLKNRVHLLGLRKDISRLTAGLDIATSSSLYGEGFSNTIGEAMACGVPCVVTDVGDSAMLVGDAGIVIPPGSPQAMVRAWGKLLHIGCDGRKELGMKARSRMESNYEIGYVTKQFERLYEQLAT